MFELSTTDLVGTSSISKALVECSNHTHNYGKTYLYKHLFVGISLGLQWHNVMHIYTLVYLLACTWRGVVISCSLFSVTPQHPGLLTLAHPLVSDLQPLRTYLQQHTTNKHL